MRALLLAALLASAGACATRPDTAELRRAETILDALDTLCPFSSDPRITREAVFAQTGGEELEYPIMVRSSGWPGGPIVPFRGELVEVALGYDERWVCGIVGFAPFEEGVFEQAANARYGSDGEASARWPVDVGTSWTVTRDDVTLRVTYASRWQGGMSDRAGVWRAAAAPMQD
jgi:hypothetical protein